MLDRMSKRQSAGLQQLMQERFKSSMSNTAGKILRKMLKQKAGKADYYYIALPVICENGHPTALIFVHLLLYLLLREEMARVYETASVLYDVLKMVTPGKHEVLHDKSAIANKLYCK